MPELSWTTSLAWFGVITGAVTIAGFIVSLVTGRQTTALLKGISNAYTATSTDHTMLLKAINDNQTTISQGQTTLGQILERLERNATERHQEIRDRLPGAEEGP